MSFTEQAESWRSKAHLSGARLPVLIGVTAFAALVLVFAGKMLIDTASSGVFTVEHQPVASEDAEPEEPVVVTTVVVHVGGAVVDPGVRELPEGSRVQDAIDAAGGLAEGAAPDALNLARVLTDGEQIVVPTLEEIATSADAPGASLAGGSTLGGKVNLNRATAAELDALPGVGPATAEKIVADREANGPFATVEDLGRVSGIGDKKLADLADLVCVG